MPDDRVEQMATRPVEIRVETASRILDVLWEDGTRGRYAFIFLRQHCRCAECLNAATRRRQKSDAASDDVTITEIRPVGNYAIQLVFSDRHDRGIYPFSYLHKLKAQPD